jgi:ubiquinone/menaquinone biosynthesis C-methylase UbiE
MVKNAKVDKAAYDVHYRDSISRFIDVKDKEEYINLFENKHLKPFYAGGKTKSYVRHLATQAILTRTQALGVSPSNITVLDAGCGRGELSAYFGCKGFRVIGVDISETACDCARDLATHIGVASQCVFLAESLEKLSVEDNCIDFIIGHGALHHFIKYEGVPSEFLRVMKKGAEGYFADSFGENKLFHLFHNKERMERLGDVILTKSLIENYFVDLELQIFPTDWFVMLDKLYQKILPKSLEGIVRKLSKIHFTIDRIIPICRPTLYLSGAVMTTIRKPV